MKVVYFGTPEFAVPTLDALVESAHEVVLVVAQPDRPAGRGLKLQKPPVAALALARGIRLLQPARIRDEELLRVMDELQPEIAVVVAYGKILPSSLLSVPAHGFINVHASLLPKWRGAAPIQRAIEAGEQETGVTIMRIDEELDHGPILRTKALSIDPHETTPELSVRLARSGAEELIRTLDEMRGEAVEEVEQDHERATYAPKISKDEGIINWSTPARRLYDRWRAFQPWPGLSFDVRGETIKVTKATGVVDAEATPRCVSILDSGAITIGTAEGQLAIAELQRPGKRSTAAAEVLRSLGVVTGDLVG